MNTITRPGRIKRFGAGAALLGVLVAAGCAPSDQKTPSPPSATNATPSLAAGDRSNGANNFYTSDRVDVQKVSFKNQYGMNVAGNLFVPKDLNRNAKSAAMVVGHPMGAVK